MPEPTLLDDIFDDGTQPADAHDTPEAALVDAQAADPEPRQAQLVERWRVDALHPNKHNGKLFPTPSPKQASSFSPRS